jgi:hypothetical protein
MPRHPTPPVAPPALDARDILGIVLQYSNRSCWRQAQIDATAVAGRTFAGPSVQGPLLSQ